MNKKLYFDIEYGEIIDESPNSQFATAKLLLFSSGENRHGMFCEESVLMDTADTCYEKPIIFEYSGMFRDFGTHSEKTIPAGFIVPGSKEFVRQEDGRLSLKATGRIWRRYSGKFLEVFKENNRKDSKLSVEVDLLDSGEREDGLLDMKSFSYAAACILGTNITEASPGANIEMISFAKEKEDYEQALKEEFSFRYNDLDFTVPGNIKTNVEKGLKYYKQYNIGGNSVSLSVARHFIKSEKSTSEKVRLANKNLKSKKFNAMKKSPPSKEYIEYMLYGGDESKVWTDGLCQTMDELDNKQLSYFGTISFPYKSKGDMNPALKGIDPPISLEQGNQIAVQADAIGSDEKKNGWAIAISGFKKSHEVVDGHWVKKEKENMTDEKEKVEMESPAEEEKKKVETEAEKPAETETEEKAEDKKEEKEESPEEEKKEEKMSLNSYLDVSAVLKFLEKETEMYKEVSEEFACENPNFAKVCGAMFTKMCKMGEQLAKMSEDEKMYMEENKQLKEFKADIESKQFSLEVDSTLKEIENTVVIPKDTLDELKAESKNFTLETIDGWKNAVKAKAFSFATKGKKEDDVMRVGTPWMNTKDQPKKSLWG